MKRKIAPKLRIAYPILVFTVLFSGLLAKNVNSFHLNPDRSLYNPVFAESNTPDTQFAMTLSSIDQTELSIKSTLIRNKMESIKVDQKKVKRIHNFLKSRGAPLYVESEHLVKMADKYGIDFRLVAAISIIESSGGKHCYRPYNAWGWGGSASAYTFKNWKEAIETVTRGLSRYYASGATTPALIAPRYNPHTPNEWARKVQYVMNQI